MLSPEQLEAAGNSVAAVYNDIEAKMLDHLVSSLIRIDRLDQRTVVELNLLAQSHTAQLRGYIEERAEQIDGEVRATAERLLRASDEDDLKRVGEGSPMWPQQVTATVDGVARILARDNLQMIEGAKQAFLGASIEAVTRVNTGTMTTERALHSAVRKLEREGIPIITYRNAETGTVTVENKVDVAVRRHIRTQIAQDGARMTLERIERLGIDLVEVSSHEDSRPSHAEWQGRCYSLRGEQVIDGTRYPDFYEATRYGQVDGLLGANCRHSFGPYRHGAPRAYEPDPKHPSGLSGAEVYEYEQTQRYLERQIREAKREVRGAQLVHDKTASLESRSALAKAQERLREKQAAMRELIAEANGKAKPGTRVLTRKPNREWAGDMPKATNLKASGRRLDDFLGGPGAASALKANGISKSAARKAMAEAMAKRGGTASDFAALTAKDQQAVFKSVVSELRSQAKVANAKHAARPATRTAVEGRTDAAFAALEEAEKAGASMGQEDHLRRWESQKIDERTRSALYDSWKGYIGTANSFSINRYMRGISDSIDGDTMGTIELLKGLIEKAPLKKDTTFVRFSGDDRGAGEGSYVRDVLGLTPEEFTGADAATLGRKLVGLDITDRAFVSVSSNANANVFKTMDVCLVIKAKKGTNVLFTDNVRESEAILAPGTPMKIAGVKAFDYTKDGESLTKLVLEVEAGTE